MIPEKELKLLAYLRKNSRMKLTEMSRKTGMPVSTIFEKIRGTLRNGIVRYACILNNNALGFNTRAVLILKVDRLQKHELGSFLEKQPCINSLFRINNNYDFLADAIFRNMVDLEEFVEYMERKFKIKRKEVYFIIKEVKQEDFLANPEAIQLVAQIPQNNVFQYTKT